MDLGNKIIKLRKKNKFSQEVFAEMLGVTRQTISNWELGVTKPDINQIKNMSKLFNISIDELLDNDVRDILEKKISNTEELTNKTTKNIRVIIITLYFVILIGVLGFTVYLLTNNDFTDEYQPDISCTLGDIKYFITLEMSWDENDVITDYVLLVTERDSNGGSTTDKLAAGDSFVDAIDSLRYAKEVLITQGAVCK